MPSVSGNYRATNVATIAAMITLIDAYLDIQEARMLVLGGPTILISGSISMFVTADDGATEINHRISISINCPTLADLKTLTAALSAFATVVETESAFTNVVKVDVTVSTSFSD